MTWVQSQRQYKVKLEKEANNEVPGIALALSLALFVAQTFLNHRKSPSNFADAKGKSVKTRVGTEMLPVECPPSFGHSCGAERMTQKMNCNLGFKLCSLPISGVGKLVRTRLPWSKKAWSGLSLSSALELAVPWVTSPLGMPLAMWRLSPLLLALLFSLFSGAQRRPQCDGDIGNSISFVISNKNLYIYTHIYVLNLRVILFTLPYISLTPYRFLSLFSNIFWLGLRMSP